MLYVSQKITCFEEMEYRMVRGYPGTPQEDYCPDKGKQYIIKWFFAVEMVIGKIIQVIKPTLWWTGCGMRGKESRFWAWRLGGCWRVGADAVGVLPKSSPLHSGKAFIPLASRSINGVIVHSQVLSRNCFLMKAIALSKIEKSSLETAPIQNMVDNGSIKTRPH